MTTGLLVGEFGLTLDDEDIGGVASAMALRPPDEAVHRLHVIFPNCIAWMAVRTALGQLSSRSATGKVALG